MSSRFFTGWPLEFFHPFFFHPRTQAVEQLMAYCESDSMVSGSAPGWARKASSTAHSSPIWLVPFEAPPASQSPSCSWPGVPPACGVWSAHAHPIGPFGLPSADPSVETVIVMPPPYGQVGIRCSGCRNAQSARFVLHTGGMRLSDHSGVSPFDLK